MRKFFIAGCQRSGTTLMRLILDSHSRVRCFDETEGYKILTTNADNFDGYSHDTILTGFKIPRFTEQLLESTMNDLDYGTFSSFYNNDPVIFLVRDYRDVVRSMIRLRYPDGESWVSKYGAQILKYNSLRSGFNVELKKEIDNIDMEANSEHIIGALYWKYKTDALFSLSKANIPIFVVSYELLVQDPFAVLNPLMKFLQIEWQDSLLYHNKIEHTELDCNGIAIGGTDSKLPIHKNSVKAYNNFFTSDDLQRMHELVCGTLTKLSGFGINFLKSEYK